MPTLNRTVVNILLLAFISLGCMFLIWHMHSYRNEVKATPISLGHDTYLHHATLKKTNEFGKLENTLEAHKIHHYPNQSRTELEQPKLHVFDDKGEHWIITAHHATSFEGTSEITLNDQVHIVKTANAISGKVEMHTSKLIVHPQEGTADSDQPVTISYPQLSINGLGLHSDLKRGTFKILDKIGASYDPTTATAASVSALR